MAEDELKYDYLQFLPTEILLYIFTDLPGKQLIRCRQVCVRWKYIIDEMVRSDDLWRKHCLVDFKKIYKEARSKARVGLLWFHIYRSLSLWPKLSNALESRNEFASAEIYSDKIIDFTILKDGIIGVHKFKYIAYYDIETMELSNRGTISGDYVSYMENDNNILLSGMHLQLYIIRKIIYAPGFESSTRFHNVKRFILANNEVYYVTVSNEVFVCHLNDKFFLNESIGQLNESIMSLSYTTQLNLLTFQRNIYRVVNKQLQFVCTLDENSNLLHIIHKHHFLETLDWRVFVNWMFIFKRTVPDGPLRDITTVKIYGEILFVGSTQGVLRIYQVPSSEELDFFTAEPLKQYNFMERSDVPVLSMCPIVQIDVMESKHGHTVIVAMPKKIAIIELVHNFKTDSSVVTLPHKDSAKEFNIS